MYQQLIILIGFLLLGYSWFVFGIVFALVHLPVPLVVPWRFGLLTMFAALPGGMLFAYLYSLNVVGFVAALALHFGFYTILPWVLGSKFLPQTQCFKR